MSGPGKLKDISGNSGGGNSGGGNSGGGNSGDNDNYTLLVCYRQNNELIQFQKTFYEIIKNLEDSTKIQMVPIQNRFFFCYKKLHKKVAIYKFLYYLGHSVVTIGSLIVPALLSIQYNTDDITNSSHSYMAAIYWSTWVLSLLVTIFNGIITLFKIDRNYYLYNIYLEKLKSETYQYFSLSGRYTGYHTGEIYRQRTYVDQLIVYSYVLEKIYMKLVENEFAQIEDGAHDKSNPQKKDASQTEKQIGLSPTNPLQMRQSPFESLVSPRNNDKKNESSTHDSDSIDTTSTKKNEVVHPDIENQIKKAIHQFFMKDSDENQSYNSRPEDNDAFILNKKPKDNIPNKSQKKPWK